MIGRVYNLRVEPGNTVRYWYKVDDVDCSPLGPGVYRCSFSEGERVRNVASKRKYVIDAIEQDSIAYHRAGDEAKQYSGTPAELGVVRPVELLEQESVSISESVGRRICDYCGFEQRLEPNQTACRSCGHGFSCSQHTGGEEDVEAVRAGDAR